MIFELDNKWPVVHVPGQLGDGDERSSRGTKDGADECSERGENDSEQPHGDKANVEAPLGVFYEGRLGWATQQGLFIWDVKLLCIKHEFTGLIRRWG